MSVKHSTCKLISVFVAIFGITVVTAVLLLAYSEGPPPKANGGLSVASCNQINCHTGFQVNSPSSKSAITLTGFPANYNPGQTYSLTVKVGLINPADQTSPVRKRFGFQLSARATSNGAQAGSFNLPNSNVGFDVVDGRDTVSSPNPIPPEGILFISHANIPSSTCINQTSCTWTFNWVAPNPAVGAVEFDVAGNSANGDNDNTGDYILTTTFTSNAGAPPPAPQFAAVNPISPNNGSMLGGTVVTINGSNFVSGATVFFGSASAATTFFNSTQLSATTPPAAAGAVSVKVQNPDSQSATLPSAFTYVAPPPPQWASSNASAPHIGPTSGGTPVTLNGSNFLNGAVVFFGSTPASTQFMSSTQLRATAPSTGTPGAVDLTVRNPDQQTATLPGAFTYFDDSLKVAYAVATSANETKSAREAALSLAPVGGGIFSLSQNGALVTTVGTSSASPTTSLLMFADTKPFNSLNGALPNKTGIAIINKSGGSAALTYTLWNPDGSKKAGPIPGPVLAEGEHFQGFVNESNFFGDEAKDFVGTFQVDSTQPISAITLQQTDNQRREALLTSTPVADLMASAPSGNFTLAQLADGSGFQTRFILLNTTNGVITGRILIFKDDPMAPDFDFFGLGARTEIPYTIQPHGEFSILSTGLGALRVGFALVVPDAGKATPIGTGMFVFTPGPFTVTTVGVPSSTAAPLGLIFIDTNPTAKGLAQNTGVSVANQSATQTADVTFKLRDLATGNVVKSIKLSQVPGHTVLPPHGHTALFASEIFPVEGLNFTGTMSIETDSPEGVSALTLLQIGNERKEDLFTTLPVAIASSSTGPVFLPQLVSGGGFETQIVLLNPALAAVSGLLSFFSGGNMTNGLPVLLPLNDSVTSSFQFSIPSNGGAAFK